MKTSDFDFELPTDLVASRPLETRDASRMLVVHSSAMAAGFRVKVGGANLVCQPTENGGQVCLEDRHIRDILEYIREGDVIVFNDSRVIPARFMAGKHEFTLHTAVADNVWWALCRKFTRLKRGTILDLADGTQIEVLSTNIKSGAKIKFLCDDPFAVLERVGKLPLPPYMKREEELADRERYQTVYASKLGSMAAPTAGLHFTPELMEEIKARGAKVVKITLHVGAGTWLPVKEEDLTEHKMHSEWGEINEQQARIINKARRVIAVGTTSLRLLESAANLNRKIPPRRRGKRICPFKRKTSIFITPGYEFKAVDMLLTNFHLPKSTLFMLVSAFSGLDNMKAAYKHAVDEKYRFFSYGDCCLLYKQKIKKPKPAPAENADDAVINVAADEATDTIGIAPAVPVGCDVPADVAE